MRKKKRAIDTDEAEIDLTALVLDLELAVLGLVPDGDVEAGEDLQARQDGRLQRLGRTHGLHQATVDAVAHAHRLVHALDVDVAGLLTQRAQHDQVDQLDRRDIALGRSGRDVLDVVLFLDRELAGTDTEEPPNRSFERAHAHVRDFR